MIIQASDPCTAAKTNYKSSVASLRIDIRTASFCQENKHTSFPKGKKGKVGGRSLTSVGIGRVLTSARDELNELSEDSLEHESVFALKRTEILGHGVEGGIDLNASVKVGEDLSAVQNVLHRGFGLVESTHDSVADTKGGMLAHISTSVRSTAEGVEGLDEVVLESEVGDVPILGSLASSEGSAAHRRVNAAENRSVETEVTKHESRRAEKHGDEIRKAELALHAELLRQQIKSIVQHSDTLVSYVAVEDDVLVGGDINASADEQLNEDASCNSVRSSRLLGSIEMERTVLLNRTIADAGERKKPLKDGGLLVALLVVADTGSKGLTPLLQISNTRATEVPSRSLALIHELERVVKVVRLCHVLRKANIALIQIHVILGTRIRLQLVVGKTVGLEGDPLGFPALAKQAL